MALFVGFFLLCLAGSPAIAENGKPTEFQVKAVYLYNFGKFVTWPSDFTERQQSFDLCVLGADPFGVTLDQIVKGERLGGKPANVRRIAAPADADNCAIVFIAGSEERRLADVLPLLARRHVLTVSDMPRFTERGGIIGFVMEGDRVRFAVNQTAAQEAGLQLSSELLKVAVSVKRADEKGKQD